MERVLGDFRYMERGLVTYIFVLVCVLLVLVWCGCGLGESSGEGGFLSFHQKKFLMN